MNTIVSYNTVLYKPDEYSKLIKKLIRVVKTRKAKKNFDCIAFRGTSGAAAAYPISASTKIPIAYVRKEGDSEHALQKVEGVWNANSYAIIDDFVVSGETVHEIVKAMKESSPQAKLTTLFLYGNSARHETIKEIRKACKLSKLVDIVILYDEK